jgi:ADP-ribose pyrophosphatase YjhB (NUDIX family)
MDKPLTLNEFERIYAKVPRLCIDLIAQDNQGGFLLTKRAIKPAKGMWHLPGGTLIRGEKIVEAIKRIATNELGVEVKIIRMVGIVEYLDPNTNAGGHTVALEYLVKLENDQIKLDAQASEAKFSKKIPDNTIKEIKDFLNSLKLI